VYSTLVESAVLAYDFARPPLSPEDREQYYEESKRMAALFGIPAIDLPADWTAFTDYTAKMFDSPLLTVDENARRLGDSVISGVGTWVHPPAWYRALTSYWMPPRLRTGFGLVYASQEQQAVHRTARWLPKLYRLLPRTLRFVGPYHEAEARLHGRPPGMIARKSNCFWMGQPRLLYPTLSKTR
jgi:uncharacterized protein (DUF2236 family)